MKGPLPIGARRASERPFPAKVKRRKEEKLCSLRWRAALSSERHNEEGEGDNDRSAHHADH